MLKLWKVNAKAGDATVTDEQVTERVESFRKAFAKFEDAKEGDAIAEGDFVQFDYAGALDDHLNEHGYIVPGLGDAGDRIYGTL